MVNKYRVKLLTHCKIFLNSHRKKTRFFIQLKQNKTKQKNIIDYLRIKKMHNKWNNKKVRIYK